MNGWYPYVVLLHYPERRSDTALNNPQMSGISVDVNLLQF